MNQFITEAARAAVSGIQMSYLKNGTWVNFGAQAQNAMDGIKIQTASNSSYYLQYRTWNQGRTDYYPYVKSNEDDYAGSSGKPMQRLQIQAYQNDGTKLTSSIVVMYRAYVNGQWLPWVSNADPEWMVSVQKKYNLGGSLDTNGSYAGKTDTNISGIEIRVYEEGPLGDFSGGEAPASLSYMMDTNSNWNAFDRSTLVSHIDGIKIQTGTNKPYYLSYQTWNAGQAGFYPAVRSTENDYAGSAGKPIQQLSIKVYKNDGTKLTSGVIVMYRAYVNGVWLPWVSNADPQWMRNVQSKYSLGGTLDTSGFYAGKTGENISGVEIRIFEEDSLNAGSDPFTGAELNLALSYMADSNTNWTGFSKSATASHMDGIRIVTTSDQSYYLTYKTWNEGRDYYYPEVTSTGGDYAGSAGKPIQRLSIHAYASDGTKLTSGIVIMYRALVDGRWLPWVSNADPQWMQSVQKQYSLDGTLDTAASYAGIAGKNISGIEIRGFSGTNNSEQIPDLPGTETSSMLSYMVDNTSNWHPFTDSVITNRIDGIKIQTSSSKPYYIQYKTWNAGKTSYYPEVTSRENDYAGSPGKAVQRLSLHVYRNDGVKLTSGIVVMYRAYVNGGWLPWVSNADPEWMVSVQNKYNLGGSLDTAGSFAGIPGTNIGGIQIRIFEENQVETVPPTPTGKHKIIQVPFISQRVKYPTGCESVTSVMALNYAGVNISVDSFIDNYLSMSATPFDPNLTFGGNPRSTSGYGCYAPVIRRAMDKILANRKLVCKQLGNASLSSLCTKYIDKNIPVILWATMYMNRPRVGSTWYYNGKKIEWITPEHCLLLVGYDDDHYIFNDPLDSHALTYYSKSSVETAYQGLHAQAIVIVRQDDPIDPPDPVDPPPKPETVFKYGSVLNPETNEYYPIMYYENGKAYWEPVYEHVHHIRLDKTNFNWAKFISGLEFDDSMAGAASMPGWGAALGIVIGGITSASESWETLYIDIDYYKVPTTGQKKAVIQCGASKYRQLFDRWDYTIPQNMKLFQVESTTDMVLQAERINNLAKSQYGFYKNIIPNDSYKYDMYITFDERRKDNPYASYLFLGDKGQMYEYAMVYNTEKIEIRVVKPGILGFDDEVIDRLDILPLMNQTSKLPADKAAIFTIDVKN